MTHGRRLSLGCGIALMLLLSAGAAGQDRGRGRDQTGDETALALKRCRAAPQNGLTIAQAGCIAAAERAYDARMNTVYRILMARLEPAGSDRLRRSQRAWLAFRDAEALTRTAVFAQRTGPRFMLMEREAGMRLIGERARMLERYNRLPEFGL